MTKTKVFKMKPLTEGELVNKLQTLSNQLFWVPQKELYYGSEDDMRVAQNLSTFILTAKKLFKSNPEAAKTAVTTLDSTVLQRRKSAVRHQLYLLRRDFGLVAPKMG
ncbi:MAG: hypothetical protein AB7S81_04300 [Bdellovibrionales bacterium]